MHMPVDGQNAVTEAKQRIISWPRSPSSLTWLVAYSAVDLHVTYIGVY